MTTDLYCVMGNPVEHSKSPWIHARFAQLTGQDLQYVKRLIPFDGFPQSVQAFRAEGGKGCNITVPFKFEAAPLATQLTPRASWRGHATRCASTATKSLPTTPTAWAWPTTSRAMPASILPAATCCSSVRAARPRGYWGP